MTFGSDFPNHRTETNPPSMDTRKRVSCIVTPASVLLVPVLPLPILGYNHLERHGDEKGRKSYFHEIQQEKGRRISTVDVRLTIDDSR